MRAAVAGLVALAALGAGTLPAQEAAPASPAAPAAPAVPAAQETAPPSREVAITVLRVRLDEARTAIEQEEQALYLQSRPPLYTYEEQFAALRRHDPEADRLITQATEGMRRAAALRGQYAALEARYNRTVAAYRAAAGRGRLQHTDGGMLVIPGGGTAGTGTGAGGTTTRRGTQYDSAEMRRMKGDIKGMEADGRRMQAEFAAHEQRWAALRTREGELRYQEKVVHDAAVKVRDRKIRLRYNETVRKDPSLTFIAEYEGLERAIENLQKRVKEKEGAIKMLRDWGNEDKVGPLEAGLKVTQGRLAEVGAQRQALADAYFAEREETDPQ